MKIGAIIQARTSSTRLPKKVLKTLPYWSGNTILQHVIHRLRKVKILDTIIVATTIKQEDEAIVAIAHSEDIAYFRGSEYDVLGRYYLSAKEHDLDVIVRITSDCPCLDAAIVQSLIEKHISDDADYTSNVLNRTFPHGLDAEVITFAALEEAHFNASHDYEREHVTPFIYKSNPDHFKIATLKAPQELYAPHIRLTVDTPEDYALLCVLFDQGVTTSEGIIDLFKTKPWLHMINGGIAQKKVCSSAEEEIAEAIRLLSIQDLPRASSVLSRDRHFI